MKNYTFSSVATRLFFRLFTGAVASFIISFFTLALSESAWLIAGVQLLNFCIIIMLCYSLLAEVGGAHTLSVSIGRRKFDPFWGLYAGLAASSPFILTGILLIISRVGGVFDNFINYYRLINAFYFPLFGAIIPVGRTMSEQSTSSIIFALSTLLFIPLLCMFAYLLGLYKFSFSEMLLFKKVKETNEE